MFEPESHTSPPDSSERIDYTDTMTIASLPLVIQWSVDVDSPDILEVYIDLGDEWSPDIFPLLQGGRWESKIFDFLCKRMDEMKRETDAWKGQYNNV